jgi:hypothetical protein
MLETLATPLLSSILNSEVRVSQLNLYSKQTISIGRIFNGSIYRFLVNWEYALNEWEDPFFIP